MKKLLFPLSLVLLFICTSFIPDSEPQVKSASYSYTIWSEIDFKNDSILFTPVRGMSNSLAYDGLDEFNLDSYKLFFKNNKTNFWNIIHEEIVINKLQIFYPFNPNWFNEEENGGLKYPVINPGSEKNFLNSKEVRSEMFNMQILGYYGPESDIPFTDMYGDDSISIEGYSVYPPRESIWYQDTDIIKYKIREEVIINKKGKETNRIIKSIAPIVYNMDHYGTIQGEKALFWISYEDLTPILKEHFLILPGTENVISYHTYLEDRMFDAKVVKEEKFKVNKVDKN